MNEKQVFELAKQMHDKGANYEEIAKALNEKKIRSTMGRPYSGALVSKLFLANGIRKKKGGKRRSPSVAASGSAQTKWDLLAAIERCADLKPASKKALIELAFKEMLQ